MRFEAQRAGAEEWELLAQALRKAPEESEALIQEVCSNFRVYTRDGDVLMHAREEVIRLLEKVV